MSADADRIGAWVIATSRKTGARYFFHPATNASLWLDAALPHGWGWGRASETAPVFYEDLFSGARTGVRPTAPAAEPDGAAPSAKRARVDAPLAPGDAVPGVPLPRLPRLAGDMVMGFCEEAPPCLALHDAARAAAAAAAAAAPPSAPPPTSPFFGPEHALVLRQLLHAAVVRHGRRAAALKHHLVLAGRDAADAEEEAMHEALLCWDIGAGSGASTAFLLNRAPPSAEVYAIDLWDEGGGAYYADQLRAFGHDAKADAWSACDMSSDLILSPPISTMTAGAGAAHASPSAPRRFHQFCARFWDAQLRVIPATIDGAGGVAALARVGIIPALVYVDADLSEEGVRGILETLWSRFDPTLHGDRPRPLLAGGGWDLSEGVRSAVRAFAIAHALPLHVEGGKCWTFEPSNIVKETRNDAAGGVGGGAGGGGGGLLPLSAEGAAAAAATADALRVREKETLRAGAISAWQVDVFGAIEEASRAPYGGGAAAIAAMAATPEAKSELATLARAVGSHGARGAAVGAGAGAGAGAGVGDNDDDPFSGENWLDLGGSDKRHLTPLMAAAKGGKLGALTALIDTHGAGVNVQAARSSYTALICAAYDGHESCVRFLLSRGADRALVNKHGETALMAAQGRRHAAIVEMLK